MKIVFFLLSTTIAPVLLWPQSAFGPAIPKNLGRGGAGGLARKNEELFLVATTR